jgi:hypothetical protein
MRVAAEVREVREVRRVREVRKVTADAQRGRRRSRAIDP